MTRRNNFKSQDKSLRKQMVIDSAIKVFHQKGYRSATLDDVAYDLGLTKPALYHYVSSKEKLLSQIYLQALERFFSYIYEIPKLELSPTEKMRLFIRRHLKTVVIENLAMFSVFFSEENQLPPEDFQRIREEKRKFNRVIEEIIQEGMDQGHFRRLNPKLMSYAIIGMCNWLYRWYNPETSPFNPDEIADQFVSLLEDGYTNSDVEGWGAEDGSPRSRVDGEFLERKRSLLDDLKEKSNQVSSLVDELKMLI